MKRVSFSNAVLKNIAYASMFIDHFFAVVFWNHLVIMAASGADIGRSYVVYRAGRAIGRIAFVLFAYLAVEGFQHTRDRLRYLSGMGIFALLSEIPFDLAFKQTLYAPESQNVYFTLFLGILALMAVERFKGYIILQGTAVAGCCFMAGVLRTDYMFMGVLLIVVFYCFREDYLKQVVFGGIVLYVGIVAVNVVRAWGSGRAFDALAKAGLSELYGLAAFALLAFYNKERGRHLPKLFCYAFYPLHLLLLYGVRCLMNG